MKLVHVEVEKNINNVVVNNKKLEKGTVLFSIFYIDKIYIMQYNKIYAFYINLNNKFIIWYTSKVINFTIKEHKTKEKEYLRNGDYFQKR